MTDEEIAGYLERWVSGQIVVPVEAGVQMMKRAAIVLRSAASMAAALEACRKYIPGSMVRSWPPGHRLRDEALKASADALAAYREGK